MNMPGGILSVLLLAAWGGCYALARELAVRRHIAPDWPLSVALASVFWGALVAVITELCSLARLLNSPGIALVWTIANGGILFALVRLAGRRGVTLGQMIRTSWTQARAVDLSSWPWDARCYLGVTVALVGFLLAIALTFATTNWDALNYHLPRIMHWAQQGSVDHFPTNNSRHLEFGPWSGFLSLHLYLLTGDDRLINVVQWSAMIGSLVLVFFVVKELTFDHLSLSQQRRISAFTCLLTATLPIGLVQCMNPQNDYVAAFWLCCLVCFVLALRRDTSNSWYMLGAGLAAGVGALAKATTYLYAGPLIIAFAIWWLWQRFPLQQKIKLAGIFCAAFFLLNSGHILRNVSVFGAPLGSRHILSIERNSRITVSGTAANLVRNLSLHGNTPVPTLTYAAYALFDRLHGWTGRAFDDPEISYHIPGYFWLPPRFAVFDSYASAPFHATLILLALALACARPRCFHAALRHAAWIVVSFLIFCAFLRWQYWHTRLHLAYFVLLMPVVGWILVERLPRFTIPVIAAGVVSFGCYTLAQNSSRPFLNLEFATLPRERQYLFAHAPGMTEPTKQLATAIVNSGCTNVGLKLDFDAGEYPLWVMLRNRGFTGVLHHVYVENESRNLPSRYPEPEIVIVSSALSMPSAIKDMFPVSTAFGRFTVMSKRSLVPNSNRELTSAH